MIATPPRFSNIWTLPTPRFWIWAHTTKFCVKNHQWMWEDIYVSNGGHFPRSIYTAMHMLNDFCNADASIRGKWSPCLLALDISFTRKWIHVVRHHSHVHEAQHILDHFHVIDVEMPQPLMPKLWKLCIYVEMCQKNMFRPYSSQWCPGGTNWTSIKSWPTSHPCSPSPRILTSWNAPSNPSKWIFSPKLEC